MMHFLTACRKFGLGTTVYNSGLGSQSQSSPGCVHGNVSASDDNHLLTGMDRSLVIVPVCLHKVVSCKELICREYSVQVLARDSHELRKSCT